MNDDFKPTVTVRWPVTVTTHYNDGSPRDVVRRVRLVPGERLEKRRTTLTLDGPPWRDTALDRQNGETILFGGPYHRPYQTYLDARTFEEDTPVALNDHLIRAERPPA